MDIDYDTMLKWKTLYEEEAQKRLQEEQKRIRAEQGRIHAEQQFTTLYNSIHLSQELNKETSLTYTIDDVLKELRVSCALQDPHKYPNPGIYSLQDRNDELTSLCTLMVHNFTNRFQDHQRFHTFMLIPGGSGLGKTRLGYEAKNISIQRLSHNVRYLQLTKIERKKIVKSFTSLQYVYINFFTGFPFHSQLDEQPPGVRMGVRFAAATFAGTNQECILTLPSQMYKTLSFTSAFEWYITHFKANHKLEKDDVVTVILHLDEFHYYESILAQCHSFANVNPRVHFKEMLDAIGSCMQYSKLRGEFCIVPIITGTAAYDLTPLKTDFGKNWIFLKPLTMKGAMAMAAQHYHSQPFWYHLKTSVEFQTALDDTGYIPLYLKDLFNWTPSGKQSPGQFLFYYFLKPKKERQMSGHREVIDIHDFHGINNTREILLYALARIPVSRNLVLPEGNKTIQDLERDGVIFLSPLENERFDVLKLDPKPENIQDQVIVHLPFVLIRILNFRLGLFDTPGVMDDTFLFSPSALRPWYWQDFEALIPHWLELNMEAIWTLYNRKYEMCKQKVSGLNDIYASRVKNLVSTSFLTQTDADNQQNQCIDLKKKMDTLNLQLSRLTPFTNHEWPIEILFPGAEHSPYNTGIVKIMKENKYKITFGDCFQEAVQCLHHSSSTLLGLHQFNVLCTDGIRRDLTDGIFTCKANNYLIDHRRVLTPVPVKAAENTKPYQIHHNVSLPQDVNVNQGLVKITIKIKPLYLLIQAKHSVLGSTTCVTTESLVRWYQSMLKIIAPIEKEYDFLFVFITNRDFIVSKDVPLATFWAQCPNLILVTKSKISTFFSKNFAFRGLIATDADIWPPQINVPVIQPNGALLY